MKSDNIKFIEYIQVESRILRVSDPRTKGARKADWEGYNKAMDKMLITASPIDIDDMKNISLEYGVPFFREAAMEVVTKWNELISTNDL